MRARVRVAVYSAIYGDYERAARPVPPDLPCLAIMYTDRDDLVAPGWDVRVVKHRFASPQAAWRPDIVDPMLAHKWWKCHPREAVGDLGVDASIWLDGSMEICGSGAEFVANNLAALGEDDWAGVRHPWRDCVYTEGEYSATLVFRYNGPALLDQIAYYRDAWGHPDAWGLFATGHITRRHTEAVAMLGRAWWWHNVHWSHQDQVSLPVLMRYVSEVRGLRFNYNLPWHQWWQLHPHGA